MASVDKDVLFEATGVSAGYGDRAVVKDCSVRLAEGSVVGLVGPNGSGKSTLLFALSGHLSLISGSVRLRGVEIGAEGLARRARRGLALCMSGAHAFESHTVAGNFRLAERVGWKDRSADPLDMFPRLEPLADRRAGLLSRGERQMLAVALTLTGRPDVMLFDEISEGLAHDAAEEILGEVVSSCEERKSAALIVDHNIALLLGACERLHFMEEGEMKATVDAADSGAESRLEELYFGAVNGG